MSAYDRDVLSTDVQPSHYDLEITPHFDTDHTEFFYNGFETIEVEVKTATVLTIKIHAEEIIVEKATFLSGIEDLNTIPAEQIEYNLLDKTVLFSFSSPLPQGQGRLQLSFRGILNSDMAGFYRSAYTDVNGKKKLMVSTQFAPLDARRAFPCWDEPSLKCTFTLSLIIPAHLTAVSNMNEKFSTLLKGSPRHDTGVSRMKKKVVFDKTPKMSTYLLAWAVGEFDFISGVTKAGVAIRVFSPPGRAAQGTFALKIAIRALDFYNDFFQLPYPLPKLDMLAVTEFAFGATENWGLVTYRETALLLDEHSASAQAKQRVAIVVVHELAHQWFGNLVTMQWWDGLWLNEGFAAFMEHFGVDAILPEYKIWDQYVTDSFGDALKLDALRSSHPVVVPIQRAEDVEQVFDVISYRKGSAVVRTVQTFLGEELFRRGLQNYLQKFAFSNSDTEQLWAEWTKVSGQNVSALMHTWTTRTGYPCVKVISEEWTDSTLTVTLQQSRFFSDGGNKSPSSSVASLPSSAKEEEEVWSIPLLFATPLCISSLPVIMDQRRQTFSIPLTLNNIRNNNNKSDESAVASSWVKINAGHKALARVAHSPDMIRRLLPAVRGAFLPPVDRAGLLLDAFALAKAGDAPLEDVGGVLGAMRGEESLVGWTAVASVLSQLSVLFSQLSGEGERQASWAFHAFGKELVLRGLARVGWESRPGESHTEKLLRAKILGLLEAFAANEPAVLSEARRRFDAYWGDPTALPSEYRVTVFRLVLRGGGEDEWERILGGYRETQDSQQQKYALASLGAARDVRLKKRTLDWALHSGEVRLQDLYFPFGSVSGGEEGSELTWTYFQQNFETISGKLSNAWPALMDSVILNSVGSACTPQRSDDVEMFFRDHPLPSSARRVAQMLENMRASGRLLEMLAGSSLASPQYWEKL